VLDHPHRLESLYFQLEVNVVWNAFPLKIKLLSPQISVEWLNVFVLLHLINRHHIGEELSEDHPILILESQLDGSEGCNGKGSSESGSNWGDRVTYLNPCMCGRNSWLIFLSVRKVVKECTLTKIQVISMIQSGPPFFSSCGVLIACNERIVGVPSLHLTLWMSCPESGLCRIQLVIG